MDSLARPETFVASKIAEEEQLVLADAEPMTIGELAHEAHVTLRALRFYQSKGLLAPSRDGRARVYSQADRDRLASILQGKRLGFTLCEIRDMLAARSCDKTLPISRKQCVEQIKLLERQRCDIELALSELRAIYTGMFKAVVPLSGEPLGSF